LCFSAVTYYGQFNSACYFINSTSARSDYVAIGPDGRKLTSSTGTDAWKHKDSKAKTHYSFNELTGEVESRV
jgi:hypothetical protein